MAELLGIIAPLRKLLAQDKQTIFVNGMPVLELQGDRTYIVPDFQREIRWDEDNVSLLIDDLKSGKCYLGNVILTKDPDNKFEIIDGQQRLTVITMIIQCIKRLHGSRIEVLNPCSLQIKSFETLNYLIDNGFSEVAVSSEEVRNADKLHQIDKYHYLWKYIEAHPTISNQREASILLENIERSIVNLIVNQSDDIRDGIRYFIDVNLKGKQLDPEDIFKSYLFKNDRSVAIRNEWYKFKTNVALAETRRVQYPLLKFIEHFLFCDLYKNSKFKGLEFNDEFKLKKEFKTKEDRPQTYRRDCHIIEVIADNQYLLDSFTRLNQTIEIMNEIAGSIAPTCSFEELFPCISEEGERGRLQNIELTIVHNIMRKVLRDSNILPKALLMKYILSVLDKSPKKRKSIGKYLGYIYFLFYLLFLRTRKVKMFC